MENLVTSHINVMPKEVVEEVIEDTVAVIDGEVEGENQVFVTVF